MLLNGKSMGNLSRGVGGKELHPKTVNKYYSIITPSKCQVYVCVCMCSHLLAAVWEFNTAYVTGNFFRGTRACSQVLLVFSDFRFSDICATTTTTIVHFVCANFRLRFSIYFVCTRQQRYWKNRTEKKKIFQEKQKKNKNRATKAGGAYTWLVQDEIHGEKI